MTEQPPNFARRRVRRDRHARRAEAAGEPTGDRSSEQATSAPTTAEPPAAATPKPDPASAAPARPTAAADARRRIERPRRDRPAAGPGTTESATPADQLDSAAAPTTQASAESRPSATPASGRTRRDAHGEHESSGPRGTATHSWGGQPDRLYRAEHSSPRPGEPVEPHQAEGSAPSAAPTTASPTAQPTGSTGSTATGRPTRWQPQHGFRRDPERNERGLRGLVGSGPSQVGLSGAMRARDAAQPTAADLQAAETELVIVRRHYVPPDQLPEAGSEATQPRGGT